MKSQLKFQKVLGVIMIIVSIITMCLAAKGFLDGDITAALVIGAIGVYLIKSKHVCAY